MATQALPAQGQSGRSRRGRSSWPGVQHSSGPQASSTGQSSWPGWASTAAVRYSAPAPWKHALRWASGKGQESWAWWPAGQASPSPSLPQSVVQSYLEGVKTGVWQLAQALEAVQGAREALGQAHGLLRGMAKAAQTLEPLREQVVQHKQLQALSQLLPRLRAGECARALGFSPQLSVNTLIRGLGYQWEVTGRDIARASQRVTQASDGI